VTGPAHLALRLAALSLLTVIVQTSALSQLSLFGATPDIGPLVVVSVGLLAGPIPGAVTGFGVGLLTDLALLQTLGVSSLVYLTVGWFAGRTRETIRDPQASLLPLAAGALGSLLALVGFSLVQFLLGVETPVSLELVRQIVSTALINTLLALPVHALVRRMISPALPEELRRRRRRRRPPRPGMSPLISP
jgi:rod shape-determining protein MreD